MFEKEAEEIEKEAIKWVKDVFPNDEFKQSGIARALVEFAELGYNKANKWHYVKDGDLPKDEDYKLCITSNGNYYIARYEELFVNWSNQEYKEVCCPYAWKEIVFSEEIK